MDHPRVSIIILNWNGWKDTIECLESLYRINYNNYDVIVVDNNSQDESIEKIKEYCDGKIEVNSKFFKYSGENKPIKVFEVEEEDVEKGYFKNKEEYEELPPNRRLILIKNKDNYGFAGGNNIGIRFVSNVLEPKYICLLNNDTVVDRNYLVELVKVAESDEKIGIVGSKIYYYDYNGRDDVIWALGGGGIDIKLGRTWHYIEDREDHVIECEYITGCSMLIRKEILYRLKGFNERYFYCYEDTDLSVKCRKLGYKLLCATKSVLWHKVSASAGGKDSPVSVYYGIRSRIYFVKKHNSFFNYLLFLIWVLSRGHIGGIYYCVFLKKKIYLLKYFYMGIWDGIMGRYYKRDL
ncbi:glycosyl transferase family 2 [Methanofervidicoccus sp. A16]|uniref:glycosyltransferase family 2 protein n=1 Tax=Methanofervidicoccus sp. A16 TaxID=2607662 RepID=UPI0011879575|nr:glycosyltransferase family 2 protein [Methanofervidicoccus sp. A16]AXI24808.1 glycosyl transferase family 2 [Methanofervidicoccus sp. A16]